MAGQGATFARCSDNQSMEGHNTAKLCAQSSSPCSALGEGALRSASAGYSTADGVVSSNRCSNSAASRRTCACFGMETVSDLRLAGNMALGDMNNQRANHDVPSHRLSLMCKLPSSALVPPPTQASAVWISKPAAAPASMVAQGHIHDQPHAPRHWPDMRAAAAL